MPQKKKKKCICCKKRLVNPMGSQKYCTNCVMHTMRLRKKSADYKSSLKDLRIKVYGQKKGSERLR